MSRTRMSLLFLAALASPLAAQSRSRGQAQDGNAAARNAAATITEADYRRRIFLIADDSMGGRGTPSPGLEKAAAYIASEFQRLGLRPGGDSGTYFQRYRLRISAMDSSSYVMAMGRGAHGHWMLGRDALYFRSVGGPPPTGAVTGPLVLMAGLSADTTHPFGDVDVRGALVLYVPRAGTNMGPFAQRLQQAGALGLIMLSEAQGSFFQRSAASAFAPSVSRVDGPGTPGLPLFVVRDSSAMSVLTAAGEDLAALRGNGTPFVARALTGFTSTFDLRRRVASETTAPNVIGILEGSDPTLRSEYVFLTAHMDHVGLAGAGNGCTARGADSICNGADDDGSGTVGVLEAAQAFAGLSQRPRRSVVFMTVSGEERGLWGSDYYTTHPTLPLENTVADINMDMIGRYYNNQPGWRDTIVVIGKEHSSLGATANRITQEHPELSMQLIDDIWPEEQFYRRSDHFNFARRGVPILFFFNGTHPDYHQVSDSPDKIDAEKAARIVQMAFYIVLDVANTTERPQWNPESRRQIVQTPTP
jgi:peptidase M28-like protein